MGACISVLNKCTYRICVIIGPPKKEKPKGRAMVSRYYAKEEEEEEEEENERAAIIDTGMFSVKVRVYMLLIVLSLSDPME